MLRIITGTAKNTNLKVPSSARPMMDRVKTSIFDLLQFKINSDMKVLDLYAGSGALGLECLSRGASFAKFAELTREGTQYIWENAEKCRFDKQRFWVEKTDSMELVLDILHRNYKTKVESDKELYDLIFVCPPHIDTNDEIIRLAGKILRNDSSLLIAECPNDKELKTDVEGLECSEIKKYGKTKIYFYRKI